MIVSHQHRFIFIAIPKTATHTIRFALRPQLHESDWEQVELFHQSRLPFPEFEPIKNGHTTAQAAKNALGEEIWNRYYKFAFVRNPFDRFVSYTSFKQKISSIDEKYRLAIMKLIIQNPKIHQDILFRPQSDFVTDKNGKIMMDYIGRFENLQKDFDLISKKIGLVKTDLETLNQSDRKAYKLYYDEELKSSVSNYYQKDLDLFDYSFY